MLECQFDYLLKALDTLERQRVRALDVRPKVMRQFNDQLQDELRGSSAAGSCNSWYKTSDGRVTNNWSGSVEDSKARTARFELADYEALEPARA